MADLVPLWLSVRVAAAATVLIVAAGLPAAFWLARVQFSGKGLLTGLLVLPLVLPPTVLGYLLLHLLGRRTWLGGWLEQGLGVVVVFHWSGAVIASAVAAFPLFLLPARGAFEAVDPRSKTRPGCWAAATSRSSGQSPFPWHGVAWPRGLSCRSREHWAISAPR